MGNFNEDRKKFGYSQEEAYFHKENQRLIEELRKKNSEAAPKDNVIDATGRFEQRKKDAQKQDPKRAA